MIKLGLASNFQDEADNIEPIWKIFRGIVDGWVVVDSGSTDGTQERLKKIVGNKLTLIEDNMIQHEGYGYSRTKLMEFSEGMDWVLIIDGDERMFPEDTAKLRKVIQGDYDIIFLPRCHYQNWEATIVEYGSMTKVGPDWREALNIKPDWQPRLVRRTIIDGKSKVRWRRRVHEVAYGHTSALQDLNVPVIRHFGWMKSKERLDLIVKLCQSLHAMGE